MSNLHWQIYPINEFHHYRDAWQSLCDSQSLSNLLHPDFVEPLILCFGNDNARIAVLHEDKETRGLTIVEPAGSKRWQTFQPSQAPIGIFTLHENIDNNRALQTLVQQLHPAAWLLGITQLDPALFQRPPETHCLSTVDYIETARIVVEGSFEDFWKERSRNTRQNLNKQRNRFEREDIALRMDCITGADEMESVLEDYGKLESKGWKGKQGTAISLSNAQGRFYLDVMKRFANMNAAIAYRYWYNDDLAAVDLCIHGNGIIYILKTTYDESIKNSSPAMLLHQDIFQKIFDEKQFHTVEFYGRVMEWHRKWTTDIRSMYHLNIYRWPFLKTLVSAASKLRK